MNASSPPRFPRVALDVPAPLADEISYGLFDLHATGVEIRDHTTWEQARVDGTVTLLASFSSDDEATQAIAHLAAEWNPRRDDVLGDAWRDSWKEHFQPFLLTPHIAIRPPWAPAEPRPGVHWLEMDPGRAFGTGLHPTTRLVAQSMNNLAPRLTDCTILDVGCGSGVLSLCALVLGAKHARAVDNDPDAVAVTLENALRNDLAHRITADTSDVATIESSYPFIVANIEARVLIPMAEPIVRRLAPAGIVVLSGILRTQVDEVIAAYGALRLRQTMAESDWVAIELESVR
ncbi:MAG TPA: 50S ribosomal protein L11 methyltransferase [Polyangiaceae bacterium]|nr:50S ribosomal protein L11 methyltransferase [Polyangiaceae bacterium]